MKVSKPVLITLIVTVIVAGYLLFFTGKKKPPAPPPTPPTSAVVPAPQQSVASGQQTPALPAMQPQPQPQSPIPGQRSEVTSTVWERDPFLLPRSVERNVEQQPRAAIKLVAILENKKGRLAIIGNEIVGKGDYVGDEMVQEIGKDTVVLARKGQKRVIPVSRIAKETSARGVSAEDKK